MILDNADSGGAADLPEIANSIRLDGVNYFLTRTPASAGNRQTWVWSGWAKRSKLGVQQLLFNAGASTSQVTQILWRSTNILRFYTFTGGTAVSVDTSAVFRDVSAHYHVTVGFDSTQASNANRVRIFIQDVAQGVSFSGTITQNTNEFVNAASTLHHIGCWNDGSGALGYHDGYFSNVCFIAGYPAGVDQTNWSSTNLAALFAYTDPNGQWRSLSKAALTALSSAGGTNSFFLPFDNGSSTTTLGYDASSKGNNWTLTNMVRDGSVNDCWSYDTPTNNFATMGLLNVATTGSTVTCKNGNLDVAFVYDNSNNNTITAPVSITDKTYWEVTLTSATDVLSCHGVIPNNLNVFESPGAPQNAGSACIGSTGYPDSIGHVATTSDDTYLNGVVVFSGTASWVSGDVMQFAFDPGTAKLWVGKNGTWLNSGVPSSGTGQVATGNTSKKYCVGFSGIANTLSINFGQRPVSGGAFDTAAGGYFRYTPPSGFKALCTKNLSAAGSVTTSGTFTGNANADGPYVWINGTPTAMTIDGNAVTWGTHADKLAGGFKIRTASSPYNDAASNSYTVTVNDGIFKYNNAEKNP